MGVQYRFLFNTDGCSVQIDLDRYSVHMDAKYILLFRLDICSVQVDGQFILVLSFCFVCVFVCVCVCVCVCCII